MANSGFNSNQMLGTSLCCLLLITAGLCDEASDAKAREKERRKQENMNDMVDSVIEDIKTRPNFDPMKLQPPCSPLTRVISLGPIDLRLQHNVLYGMQRLERFGNAQIETTVQGSFLAKTHLRARNVTFRSLASVGQASLIRPQLRIAAHINILDIRFHMEKPLGGKSNLTEFDIEGLRGVSLSLEELPEVDSVVNIFTQLVVSIFNSTLRTRLTRMIRPIIECRMMNYNPTE